MFEHKILALLPVREKIVKLPKNNFAGLGTRMGEKIFKNLPVVSGGARCDLF